MLSGLIDLLILGAIVRLIDALAYQLIDFKS